MSTILKENERIDDLEYKGLKIIQNTNSFCFGIDAVLLSDFAKEIRNNSTVVDLGTGTGIISILLSKKANPKKIIAVEIQEKMAEMATRSVQLNSLQDIIEIENIDLKCLNIQQNSIDVVVTNPPYKKENSGILNESEEQKISRHETACTLEDVCRVSAKMLKPLGTIYMVHRPERLVDIFCEMRKVGLEPKKIRLVKPKENAKPNIVLIKAVKNWKPFLQVEKELTVYEQNGEYTDEILKIYEKER